MRSGRLALRLWAAVRVPIMWEKVVTRRTRMVRMETVRSWEFLVFSKAAGKGHRHAYQDECPWNVEMADAQMVGEEDEDAGHDKGGE